MTAKFIAEQGAATGQEFELEGAEAWNIGRDPEECQIVLEDSTISRKHLICRFTPQGFSIENLNPTNPIFVNDEEVDESQILNHGDTVRVGSVLLRFHEQQAETVMQQADEDQAPAEDSDEEAEDLEMSEEITDEDQEHETILSDEESLIEETATAHVAFDPTAGSRYVLKVVAGPNSGAQVGLEGADYLIGTDANSCDVTFHDISVSHHHARLHVDGKSGAFSIEDLDSRNGTFIDGNPVEGSVQLGTNEVVAVGTSAFVIYDKEAESQTIQSPLLPVKERLFKKPEPAPVETPETKEQVENAITQLRQEQQESAGNVTRLIVLAVVTFVLVMTGGMMITLMSAEPVQIDRVDEEVRLNEILEDYPSVRHRYDRNSKSLLLSGHLITKNKEEELLFRLSDLNLNITRRIVIDELVRSEQNEFLITKFPGVTMTTPEPGRFVLNGFLRTRQEMESLMASISTDFAYVNLLENQVIVEENILDEVDSRLQDNGMNAVTVEFNNGEVTLAGNVSYDQGPILRELVEEFARIRGIKLIRNFVSEASPQEAMINLTGNYQVSGSTERGGTSVSVVINGRILSRGDRLDGLTITSIRPNRILLEGDDGVKYRIDYNQ